MSFSFADFPPQLAEVPDALPLSDSFSPSSEVQERMRSGDAPLPKPIPMGTPWPEYYAEGSALPWKPMRAAHNHSHCTMRYVNNSPSMPVLVPRTPEPIESINELDEVEIACALDKGRRGVNAYSSAHAWVAPDPRTHLEPMSPNTRRDQCEREGMGGYMPPTRHGGFAPRSSSFDELDLEDLGLSEEESEPRPGESKPRPGESKPIPIEGKGWGAEETMPEPCSLSVMENLDSVFWDNLDVFSLVMQGVDLSQCCASDYMHCPITPGSPRKTGANLQFSRWLMQGV